MAAALAVADLPRLFALRLLALKWKEMRPALNPRLPSKLAYINASFVIPLYNTLVHHACIFAQVMTQYAHTSELFSDVYLRVLLTSIECL